MSYRVGDGKVIHWSGGAMAGGRDVPDEYLAELAPETLAVMLKDGTLVDVTPELAPKKGRMTPVASAPAEDVT